MSNTSYTFFDENGNEVERKEEMEVIPEIVTPIKKTHPKVQIEKETTEE